MRVVIAFVLAITVGCTARPAPVVAPRISPEVLAARLAEADRLASRGCYLCLTEAAAAYASLLADSDDPVVARKALENNLMLVAGEIELRIPDSGARDAAEQLRTKVPLVYDPYFAALDMQANPLPRRRITLQSYRASARSAWCLSPSSRRRRRRRDERIVSSWPCCRCATPKS